MQRKLGLLLIMAITFGSCASLNSTVVSDNEEQAVRLALDGFYASLNVMFIGDPNPAKAVWSHSEDIAYMGADGGYQVGWKAMYADWVKQASVNIGGKVVHSNVTVNVGSDIAVTHQLVKSADVDGESLNKDDSLRASSVFRKEDGKWKMIGHHVDVIPALKKEIVQ
jgi:ketosteroid isomerase-like protein